MTMETPNSGKKSVRDELMRRAIELQLEIGLPEMDSEPLPSEFKPEEMVNRVLEIARSENILRERILREIEDGLDLRPDVDPKTLCRWVFFRRLKGSIRSEREAWLQIAAVMRDVLRQRAAPLPSENSPDRASKLSTYLSTAMAKSTENGNAVFTPPDWLTIAHDPVWVTLSADLIAEKARSDRKAGEYLLLHVFAGLSSSEIAEYESRAASDVATVLGESLKWAEGMYLYQWYQYFPETDAVSADSAKASSGTQA